jgi:hypothetical protein
LGHVAEAKRLMHCMNNLLTMAVCCPNGSGTTDIPDRGLFGQTFGLGNAIGLGTF